MREPTDTPAAGPAEEPSALEPPATSPIAERQTTCASPCLVETSRSTPRLLSCAEIERALDAGEFRLCYQPKLHLRTRTIEGVEALARWTHPVWGEVPPTEFITAMEQNRQIRRFTFWALRRAIADRRRLKRAGIDLRTALNVSGQLLSDREFVDMLLSRADHVKSWLTIEITETAIIENPTVAFANLDRIVEAGITVAIDDYGSGLSSLAYLRRLPAQELKIDKMFILGMAHSNRDPLLVRSTIDLAHALGMIVTAEGVEKQSTLELLRVMGCDHAQGYIIARPMPVEALERMLADPDPLSHLTGGPPLLAAGESFW